MNVRIDVNDAYEIQYRYSSFDGDYEDFGRMHVVVLLRKDGDGDRVVLRADNCDKKTGHWPTHVHIGDRKAFIKYCGGSSESNWTSFKETFLEHAVEIVGEENRSDLEKALKELLFVFD